MSRLACLLPHPPPPTPPPHHANERISKAVQPNANWHMDIVASPLNSIFTLRHTSPSTGGIHSVYNQRFDMWGFHDVLFLLVL
jgi:hypothetical protein